MQILVNAIKPFLAILLSQIFSVVCLMLTLGHHVQSPPQLLLLATLKSKMSKKSYKNFTFWWISLVSHWKKYPIKE